MKDSEKEKDMDALIEQVGGRFKLTSLIQKRVRQIVSQRVFGQRQSDIDTIDSVLKEIAEGKVELIPEKKEPEPEDLL